MTVLVDVATPIRDYDPLAGKPYADTGLAESLANYLASKKSARRAAKTVSDKEMYLSELAFMFPSKQPGDFTAFDIMHWEAQYPHLAAESLRTRRSHVRDFFQWCVVWEIVDRNPVDKLEAVRRRKGRVYDIFEEPEVQAFCALPIIDGALLAIMLKAGLRKGECCRLQVQDVLPSGNIRVLAGKGNKDRLVGMRQSLSAAVQELIMVEGLGRTDHLWYTRVNQGRSIKRNRALGEGSFYRWWNRVCDDARVRRRNPHMTRHTFATRWLRAGGRLATLSVAMGHASIATTFDLYGHLDQRDVQADLALMED